MERNNDNLVWVGAGLLAMVLANRAINALSPPSPNRPAYAKKQQRFRLVTNTAKLSTSPSFFGGTVLTLQKSEQNVTTIIGNGRLEEGVFDDYINVFVRTRVNGQMVSAVGWLDTDSVTPIV